MAPLARLESLNLAGSPVGKETLEEAYRRAARASRLLQDEDFLSWRRDCEAGKARQTEQLINRTLSEGEANKKRGMIIALGKLFAELEIQAASLEEAKRRLEEHERERIPVDHQRWWEGLRSSGSPQGR